MSNVYDMSGKKKVFMNEEMKKLRKRYQREKEEICVRYVAEGKAGYAA